MVGVNRARLFVTMMCLGVGGIGGLMNKETSRRACLSGIAMLFLA